MVTRRLFYDIYETIGVTGYTKGKRKKKSAFEGTKKSKWIVDLTGDTHLLPGIVRKPVNERAGIVEP